MHGSIKTKWGWTGERSNGPALQIRRVGNVCYGEAAPALEDSYNFGIPVVVEPIRVFAVMVRLINTVAKQKST
jgi:hypothetical protein